MSEIDDLIKRIEENQKFYEGAIFGFAIVKEKEIYKFCYGYIKFLSKKEPLPEDQILYYDKFALVKKKIKIKTVLDIIHKLADENNIKLNSIPEFSIKGHFGPLIYRQSDRPYGHNPCKWPSFYCQFTVTNGRGNIPPEALVKRGLPLYPDGRSALIQFFDLKEVPFNVLEFIMPIYLARIKQMKIRKNEVSLIIESREIAEKELLAKFYIESGGRIFQSDDLPISNSTVKIDLESSPDYIVTHLLSKDSLDIDGKLFNTKWISPEEGVIFERTEDEFQEMIRKGENEYQEFKTKLDQKEFIESVVSFANTSGGRIFLGVDNNAQIVGFSIENVETITKMIRSNCDPFVEHKIYEINLEKPVIIVEIPEGKDKPYIFTDRGIFIRVAATDRQPTRYELDAMYNK